MSDVGDISSRIHEMTQNVKAKPPGTKLDYPPAGMTVLDVHSEYFATNAMLAPVMFSSIGVIKSELRALSTASDLDELFGVDELNRQGDLAGAAERSDDHSYEIGFDTPERPTVEVAKFAFTLLREQARTGFKLYGKDNPYLPYTIQQALDFLISAEPRDNTNALRSANAKLIDSELAELGIDLDELHANEKVALTKRAETDKESNRKLRPDIIARFKEIGTVDLVTGWNALPLLTQYKCTLKAIASLKKSMARKSALVKDNPKHPNRAQMENELAPLATFIRTLIVDCHSVYKANRQLFDDAFMNGLEELPKLGEVKHITPPAPKADFEDEAGQLTA